jgi:hypothetical protein
MANLTLSIDDDTLEEARKTAARDGTTVNAIVREQIANIASRDARISRARRRLAELAAISTATIGPRDWTRNEIYDRNYNRVPRG